MLVFVSMDPFLEFEDCGTYRRDAFFMAIRVHVSYTLTSKGSRICLRGVGPSQMCKHEIGHPGRFGQIEDSSDLPKKVVDAALSFYRRQKSLKRRAA
jgi:hypothetical protein